jgi:hypothetical protein
MDIIQSSLLFIHYIFTRWFKYDRDDLCVNKSQFVPVMFEPPGIYVRYNQLVQSKLTLLEETTCSKAADRSRGK